MACHHAMRRIKQWSENIYNRYPSKIMHVFRYGNMCHDIMQSINEENKTITDLKLFIKDIPSKMNVLRFLNHAQIQFGSNYTTQNVWISIVTTSKTWCPSNTETKVDMASVLKEKRNHQIIIKGICSMTPCSL